MFRLALPDKIRIYRALTQVASPFTSSPFTFHKQNTDLSSTLLLCTSILLLAAQGLISTFSSFYCYARVISSGIEVELVI